VRTVKQVNMKWQDSIKGLGSDLKRGLKIRPHKDELSDNDTPRGLKEQDLEIPELTTQRH
jgi:hypothetical protein